LDEVLKRDLESIVGEAAVRTDEEALRVFHPSRGTLPEAVVSVRNVRDAAEVVGLANRKHVPILLADRMGPVVTSQDSAGGKFALDFSMMNRVREMRPTDLFMTVEPGVTIQDLDFALKPARFFLPPEPLEGRSSSIGRMVLINPIHRGAEKYGLLRDYVLSMDAVMPNGDTVRLGTKTLKNSTGLQIERFLSGSCGLVSIPTAITLQVKPRPEERLLFRAGFESVPDALSAVREIGSSQVVPSSLELFDRGWSELWGCSSENGLLAVHIELRGHREAVKREADVVAGICKARGALHLSRTKSNKLIQEERDERWLHREIDADQATLLESFVLVPSVGGDTVFGTYAYCVFGSLLLWVAARSPTPGKAEEGMSAITGQALSSGGVTNSSGYRTGLFRGNPWQMTISGDEISVALKKAIDPQSILNTGGRSM
jgi:glycolate oxidase